MKKPTFETRKIRLAGPIQRDSIVDGEGLRAVVWCQGCRRHCEGCHNPESWDENGGVVVDVDYVKEKLRSFRGQNGLTFSGGEPMLQAKACREIAEFAKQELGWNVWSFTGFLYEDLKKEGGEKWELVKILDALIDGPFVLKQRDLSLKFRGSKNQRLLKLKRGEIVSVE
ncbi:MAG: anaerobic ribonucleoside-triphosphate reductase activating protein [Candidatus Nomurabacteria bacterium]|jgi:anaerobic ribonucleoside-triphosphate reductase activating protein|nr:anaerobic ribonucleoside-triphosphate reductase activating protein [Candidatus Nomurabacteria bacterium]